MRQPIRWIWVLAMVAILSPDIIRAQVQAINGSVRGRVLDQTGSPLADAGVTIENAQTGFSRWLTTSEDGYYVVPNLPLGTYSVRIEKNGFDTERHTGIVLEAGTEAV